ncbi:MAG: o-succinylbenzoate synthase [Melioribacteraceae bacterium]
MKDVELKYKSFTFPLSQKFTNSNHSFTHKEIIILKAKDERGNIAFGEVSPLPGFSKENIQDCEDRLEQFSISIIQSFNNPQKLNEELKIFDNIPSLKFGLEQVIISLMLNNNLYYFDTTNFKESIKVNGSIGFENLTETEEHIEKTLLRGISTLKLKVGRTNFEEDLSIITMIKKRFGNKIKLRLDVNGKWSFDEAKNNLRKIEQFELQYVEQPVKDKFELLELAKQSEIKIAPDESIQTIDDAIDFINSDLIDFIILKPSIRLGIFNTLKVLNLAKQKDVVPIITTSFETAIGRNMLLSLAGTTGHNFAHGLSLEVLGDSSANKSLITSNGKIKVDSESLKLNYNDLWN